MIIYNFFKYFYLNWKYSRILNKVYKNEHFISNLSSLLNLPLKKDWIGRIYVVLNPHLIEGIYDVNTQIYEYDENGLSSNAYIEKWLMDRLNIAQKYIKANNLFDLLTYKIKKLDDYDNYLLIIEPITLAECIEYSKKFGYLLITLLLLGAIIFTIFKFI